MDLALAGLVILVLSRGVWFFRRRYLEALEREKEARFLHLDSLQAFAKISLVYEEAIGKCRGWLTEEGQTERADEVVVYIGNVFRYRAELDRLQKELEDPNGS